jgi:hypothetical protein
MSHKYHFLQHNIPYLAAVKSYSEMSAHPDGSETTRRILEDDINGIFMKLSHPRK